MPGFFKSLLATDKIVKVFCTGQLAHPVAIQMFGLSGGYDGFWIDQEHAGLGPREVQLAALAGRACGMGSFARMPLTNYAAVTQALEAGVDGVMAAQVQSAAEAEQFVRWAKFAPRGMRGLNTQGADGHFTYKSPKDLVREANEEHLTAIQIETTGALEQADDIAAIDGVDLLFIGPADLSLALGILGQPHDPRMWEAIEHVASACRRHGKPWGIVPADPAAADRCVNQGCRMLTLGSDVAALRLGIQSLRNSYASQYPAEPQR